MGADQGNGTIPNNTSFKPSVGGMDAEEFRKAAYAAVDDIIKYNQSLPDLPVLPKIEPGFLPPQLPKEAPQEGEAWKDIQADVDSKIMPGLTHWQSPNFFAYFPATLTYPSIIGEMYSAAFTAPAFNWLCSPACTELETVVMDWLVKAFALPETYLSTSENGGGGVIQGSASEAVVTVMVAARERYLRMRAEEEGLEEGTREHEDKVALLRTRLVALGSEESHSSVKKGAIITGTRFRTVPVTMDDEMSMTGDELQKALEDCRSEGLEPYFLGSTLGTTNSCAVDHFTELGRVKKDWKGLWIHVDAAWAGAALICEEFQHYSKEMAVVDSFNMNMHKWLLVNFDASVLFVQKRTDLTKALSIMPAYLKNTFSDSGLVTDYRDWQIPLGRRFRALKIWFVVRTYGIKGLQQHIRRSLKLGDQFTNLVKGREDLFEIVAPPRFALTCFRVKPEVVKGIDADANAVTKEIADLINKNGQIFLTLTTILGKSAIRFVPGNTNVTEESVNNAFRVILEDTKEVLEGRKK